MRFIYQIAGLVANGAFKRGYVTGILAVNIGWDKTCTNEITLFKAYLLGVKLSKDITERKTYPMQNLMGRLINRLFVRNAFIQNVLANKEDNMKAVYENLIGRGLLVDKAKQN